MEVTSEENAFSETGLPVVMKSPNDKKEYRVIKLKNGLTALLVSDVAGEDTEEDAEMTEEEEEEEAAEAEEEEEKDNSAAAALVDDKGLAPKRVKQDSGRSDDDDGTGNDEEEMDEDEDDDDGEGEEEGEEDDDESKTKKAPKKQAKLAAAALCVGIGSFSDPDDIPGLAHFLEHMVFMGSEKYPDENSFDVFVRQHGGSDNASTSFDKTVFQFEVQKKHFREGLIRFAQFFTAPLLKEDSTDRELEAVDSEFQMSHQNDYHRRQQLMSVMCKQGHPMAKFTWGNSKSLKVDPAANDINVHQRLKEFRLRVYSSHYMTLVVQSRESLDNLEEWVREAFSDVPHNGLNQPSFMDHGQPFMKEEFCKLYKVVPVEDMHQLDILWSLPSLQKHYRCKPLHYLGWLLGHEGKGSIMALLKKRALALRLYCGNSETSTEHNETYAAFSFSIVLSDEGLKQVDEVLLIIFQYIKMLQKEGPQKRIFDEIKTIDDNIFRFFSEIDPVENVEGLSEQMQLYPVEEYITGPLIQTEYNEQLIRECTDILSLDSINICLSSKKFAGQTDRTESWFGTEYSVHPIPEKWLARIRDADLNPALHLPTPNRFIATKFDLKEADRPDTDYPSCILQTEHSRLWYRRDTKFKTPRASMCFHLMTPLVNQSPHHAVTFDLFVNLLEHQLTETAYEAEAAELGYSLKALETGLEIKLYGFDHKLPLLFETIVDAIVGFSFSEDMFAAVKENLKNSYHNFILKPAKVCRDLRLAILQEVKWTAMDKDQVVAEVSPVDVHNMARDFQSRLFFEGLVQGNCTAKEVLSLEEYLREKLSFSPIPEANRPSYRVVRLPEGCQTLRWRAFNPSDANSVVTDYFQASPGTYQSLAVLDALMTIMEEPCFDILRTQEQLGYSVHATERNTFGILGFTISVTTQANKFSASSVDQRIDSFLETFSSQLASMSEEDFGTQVDGLINILLSEDVSLYEEADRNWAYVINQEYTFDRIHRKVDILRSIKLDDVREYLRDHSPSGSKFRKLSVQVIGYGECEKNNLPQKTATENGPSDITDTPTNQDGDEVDAPVGMQDDTKSNQSASRIVPLEEGVSGSCIADIMTFKKELMLYPVTKIDS
ncbi:nardilysin-like [Diadema antillarum]|uniref:nardilysin-like n=1 Tax=Diadema antillarum TaxID=105358 RepID=UPI003A88B9CC